MKKRIIFSIFASFLSLAGTSNAHQLYSSNKWLDSSSSTSQSLDRKRKSLHCKKRPQGCATDRNVTLKKKTLRCKYNDGGCARRLKPADGFEITLKKKYLKKKKKNPYGRLAPLPEKQKSRV